MVTASESRERKLRYRLKHAGRNIEHYEVTGGGRMQTKREILAESEKLIIKPGMKLVYDEELNMMVWK